MGTVFSFALFPSRFFQSFIKKRGHLEKSLSHSFCSCPWDAGGGRMLIYHPLTCIFQALLPTPILKSTNIWPLFSLKMGVGKKPKGSGVALDPSPWPGDRGLTAERSRSPAEKLSLCLAVAPGISLISCCTLPEAYGPGQLGKAKTSQ